MPYLINSLVFVLKDIFLLCTRQVKKKEVYVYRPVRKKLNIWLLYSCYSPRMHLSQNHYVFYNEALIIPVSNLWRYISSDKCLRLSRIHVIPCLFTK